jgi:ankyrin repeat protein
MADRRGLGPPLHNAAAAGDAAAVARLLDGGDDIDGRDGDIGWTPLMVAALGNSLDAMRTLLERGADVDATGGPDNSTAVGFALSRMHTEAALLLLDATDDAAMARRGVGYLGMAAFGGLTAVAERLLDRGVPADPPPEAVANGCTPLLMAVLSWREEVARLLVARGASVDRHGAEGQAPLHAAVNGGLDTMVRFLVACGADTEATDAKGRTPLGLAVEMQYVAAAVELLRGGALPPPESEGGLGPLLERALDPEGSDHYMLMLLSDAGVRVEPWRLEGRRGQPAETARAWLAGTHPLQRARDALERTLLDASSDMPVPVARVVGDYFVGGR